MQLKSIQQKIVLWSGACLTLVVGIFIAYSAVSAHTQALAAAGREATAQAELEAGKVKVRLEGALDAARTLAQSLAAVKNEADPLIITRTGVNAMLKQVLEGNSQLVRSYTAWEPNAFDGRDEQYKNAPGYNSTGRMNFTWSRSDHGEIKVDPTGDNAEETDDWYLEPKRRMRETIAEPYLYSVQGKEVLMTSLLVPIINREQGPARFYGLAGVDVRIDYLQGLTDRLQSFDQTGQLLLITHKGVIAGATGQPQLVNQPLAQAGPEFAAHLPAVETGRPVVEFGRDRLLVFVPMSFGDTQTPWSACIVIPRAQIIAGARSLLWQQVVGGLVLIGLALALVWYLAGRLVEPIKVAVNFADQLAAGVTVEKVLVTSTDETGQLLVAMNSMLENAHSLVQTRTERDEIQRSIMHLLEQVSSVAEGDLTRRADVTEDVTGAIADAVNTMIVELRRIIGKVQVVTHQVNETAGQTQETAHQLAFGADHQVGQIKEAARAVNAITHSIQRVAENVTVSANVARQSLANARQGDEALQNTLKGMQRVRVRMQESADGVRQLNEASRQIGEIVRLIDGISNRLSLLALNASIQAAVAGESGLAFNVVAEEVQRLAERSHEATKEIAVHIDSIQRSAGAAGTALEESTREMAEGSRIAHQAGLALQEIKAVSAQLAESINSISHSSIEQTHSSEALSRFMADISKTTEWTAASMKRSAVNVKSLAALANELRASVSSFKLPGDQSLTGVRTIDGSR